MNDPDRRRSPDGFDDDAIFADIVAHLNDEVSEPQRAAQPAAEDAPTDVDTNRQTPDAPADLTRADLTPGELIPGELTLGGQPSGERPQADPDEWPSRETPVVSPPGEPPPDAAPQLWRAHEVDDEYEEHFEPPPVTPLPAGDLTFWAIIAGMAGGPLLLLYFVFFDRNASSFWTLAAIALSVGGFVLLVSRMPGHHDDDDDGARL